MGQGRKGANGVTGFPQAIAMALAHAYADAHAGKGARPHIHGKGDPYPQAQDRPYACASKPMKVSLWVRFQGLQGLRG